MQSSQKLSQARNCLAFCGRVLHSQFLNKHEFEVRKGSMRGN
ncbi:hypothetical protein LEP1GSC065_0878 [Leptospira kirschneri serovar Sokoine str. RM1]|nr:hypothetical protein LEP1GSC065_0878 [Leptospira kirschneri serovar Sokoine str. RM1]